ncbi:TetR/AcrR family transcriptional regulator [Pantoea sp. EA-12]|uniref:TetR/AcrR family transcriptional regulator n=1 Tax=Pantoea sp. EA-12 TaxID=3043303 RepID=UPI0024B4AED1|nr:TetR/AcrR family transcriptional regulator [Pantoea sp. EA-12]MDI9222413.1 TetR/AcrR family transcriptional regulator [Pantoea sp. EA-12]
MGVILSKSENETLIQQRQQLIIDAAKICFSRSGFHGASMADISRESGLGAGQIYRYFKSKELIVSETIKNIAINWRVFLTSNLPGETRTEDIINTDSLFWQAWPYQDRCLLLEMYSEASRSQSVRDVLAAEEQLLVADLEAIFTRQMPQANPQQRANRIQFLLMLVDGVACRAFGDKEVDQQELTRINGILSRHLFS